jgi:hypothetical protein
MSAIAGLITSLEPFLKSLKNLALHIEPFYFQTLAYIGDIQFLLPFQQWAIFLPVLNLLFPLFFPLFNYPGVL